MRAGGYPGHHAARCALAVSERRVLLSGLDPMTTPKKKRARKGATAGPKRGRPPTLPSSVREAVVYVRVSAEEQAAIREAAANDRRTVGDWSRLVLLDASRAAATTERGDEPTAAG